MARKEWDTARAADEVNAALHACVIDISIERAPTEEAARLLIEARDGDDVDAVLF
jgi:hypothetical protein